MPEQSMNINKVTITGADDSTDLQWMADLSEQYPFLEWGLLVQAGATGPRFPSTNWLWKLHTLQVVGSPIKTSVHVCGRWVREVLLGNWEPLMLKFGFLVNMADRMQLNTHGQHHEVSVDAVEMARAFAKALGFKLISQVDGVNISLFDPLFDMSSGAGVVPPAWPPQKQSIYTGYAGGLGPDNLDTELPRILKASIGTIWIDMETRVRTADDSELDIAAVESVMVQMEAMGVGS